ncbi:hypothetical protein Asppvi_003464 [Aspergillus pseudoviridinutans]|uniref:Uncharacterized protein n=1 Tax=Aspergillus pseudoviridinutans TaxID=1517512 RepID=A0A9P3B8E6_9EURO|nr:uncharacterized protein Asppvi_003464 [Aspergillus pseudoviridinutans]GIJ84615.1 hypothetical protein Asppvi_003464 [Aspergillus pseudoviridinutans]
MASTRTFSKKLDQVDLELIKLIKNEKSLEYYNAYILITHFEMGSARLKSRLYRTKPSWWKHGYTNLWNDLMGTRAKAELELARARTVCQLDDNNHASDHTRMKQQNTMDLCIRLRGILQMFNAVVSQFDDLRLLLGVKDNKRRLAMRDDLEMVNEWAEDVVGFLQRRESPGIPQVPPQPYNNPSANSLNQANGVTEAGQISRHECADNREPSSSQLPPLQRDDRNGSPQRESSRSQGERPVGSSE